MERLEGEAGLGRLELYGRLADDVLVFDVLRPDVVASIARNMVGGMSRTSPRRTGFGCASSQSRSLAASTSSRTWAVQGPGTAAGSSSG